ncbi:hypothetical protein BMS3Bbin14_01056 [bacterium BMS3Bbin14]|nr:hypothetical protein BMS3Bbin14_01056 [bacterium BMS3Bbin14]
MQGGNDVDYPGVISTSCQRSRCAVIGRAAGRRGEEYKMHLFVNNAINSTYCLEYDLNPSRIQGFETAPPGLSPGSLRLFQGLAERTKISRPAAEYRFFHLLPALFAPGTGPAVHLELQLKISRFTVGVEKVGNG